MPNLPRDLPWAGCPKPELVAAYVDGMLDAGDRARMAGHLADCNDCSTVLAEAIRMQRAAAGRQNWMMVPTDRRSLLKLAGSLGVAAAVCLAVWPARHALSTAPSSNRPELAQLVEAVGSRRTIEPRLTGGFAYGTLPTVDPKRSGESASVELPLELRAAAIALEKRAQGASDPLALGAFGSAQLATGLSEKAVATFEEAARLLPKDARLLSDAAAAYLVRSSDKNQIEDVARAVGFAQQAVEAAPSLAEARFNLALSLEGLSLRGEATKAWNAYLEVDPASPWADEAKRRIERLAETPEGRWEKQRRVVITASESGGEEAIRAATQQFPDTAYEFVENDLVPGWADAWLARDEPKARELARRARLFGQALADGVGERMALDVAVSIERAQASRPRADVLARGHQVFRDARALYEQDRVVESAALFRKATPELHSAQSPLAGWATLTQAIAEYYLGHLPQADALLNPLVRDASAQAYLTLTGRALRMRGLIHHVKGELGESLDSYREALSALERVRAREDLAAIHSVLSENLAALGAWRLVWRHRQASLSGLEASRTPRRRQTILVSAAKTTRRQELLEATLAVQNEVLWDALRTNRPGAVIEGYLGRAEVYGSLGRQADAAADLSKLDGWLARVNDPVIASRHKAEIQLATGDILQQTRPEQALEALLGSLEYFRDSGRGQRLARIHLALGRLHTSSGHDVAAEASFLEGIEILERQRARLPSGELRLEYFNLPWNLFDEMIALKARRSDQQASALTFAERARARDLVESLPASDAPSFVDPSRLSGTLAADTAIVYYASLESELLVWVIRAGRINFVRRSLSYTDLSRDVAHLHAAIQNEVSDDIREASAHLFDQLMRPLAALLPASTRIVVVPDGALHSVPFAALMDRTTGRYLVEDHIVAVTGSATFFARAASRSIERPAPDKERILVVGNPRLDDADAEGLPTLPGAEAEARSIANLYQGTTVLSGSEATKQAFINSVNRFSIVHFAGHAITNHSYPLLSHLLLARNTQHRSGILFAHEISRLKLQNTALVVLAACSTGGGAFNKSEGPISLARPFLAAGVPSVVATLWDVRDNASQVVFDSFYRSLRNGATPVAALRDAQLGLLRSADGNLRSPSAWAGFVVLGGGM